MTKQQITPLPNTYFGTFMHGVAEYTGIAPAYRMIERVAENATITSKYIAGTAVVSVSISTGALQKALRVTADAADFISPANNALQSGVKAIYKAAFGAVEPEIIDPANQLNMDAIPDISLQDFSNGLKQYMWDSMESMYKSGADAVEYVKTAAEANPYTTAGIVVGVAGLATAAYLGHSYYQQYCLNSEKKQLPDTLLQDVDKQFKVLEKQYRDLGLHSIADTYQNLVTDYLRPISSTDNTPRCEINRQEIDYIQNSLKACCSTLSEDKIKQLHDCSVNLLTSLQLHQRFQEQNRAQQVDRKFVDRIKEERDQLVEKQKTP